MVDPNKLKVGNWQPQTCSRPIYTWMLIGVCLVVVMFSPGIFIYRVYKMFNIIFEFQELTLINEWGHVSNVE